MTTTETLEIAANRFASYLRTEDLKYAAPPTINREDGEIELSYYLGTEETHFSGARRTTGDVYVIPKAEGYELHMEIVDHWDTGKAKVRSRASLYGVSLDDALQAIRMVLRNETHPVHYTATEALARAGYSHRAVSPTASLHNVIDIRTGQPVATLAANEVFDWLRARGEY